MNQEFVVIGNIDFDKMNEGEDHPHVVGSYSIVKRTHCLVSPSGRKHAIVLVVHDRHGDDLTRYLVEYENEWGWKGWTWEEITGLPETEERRGIRYMWDDFGKVERVYPYCIMD